MKKSITMLRIAVVCVSLFIFAAIAVMAINQATNPYDEIMLTVETTHGLPGDDIVVTVSLINNPGIAGYVLQLYFDHEVLTPLYVFENPWLGGEAFVYNIYDAPPYDYPYEYEADTTQAGATVVWGSSTNGYAEELFTIRFRINEYANPGQSYITLAIVDLMDVYRYDIHANISNVAVNVQSAVWGNVTGTGYLHIGDIVRVAQHLAAIPGMELTGGSFDIADVDRDGRITVADLILIAQHLADPYSVELGIAQ